MRLLDENYRTRITATEVLEFDKKAQKKKEVETRQQKEATRVRRERNETKRS